MARLFCRRGLILRAPGSNFASTICRPSDSGQPNPPWAPGLPLTNALPAATAFGLLWVNLLERRKCAVGGSFFGLAWLSGWAVLNRLGVLRDVNLFGHNLLEEVTMYKKVLSLMAVAVLAVACESMPENNPTSMTEGEHQQTAIPGTEKDFVVNVGDRVFFGYDRTELTVEARATLDKQAAWLKQYPRKSVTVEGHADERGTREYNLALGERRANAVKNYLAAAGVAKSSLHVISYGKERPAVLGANEAAWAQNRRGVTVVGEAEVVPTN